MDLSLVVPLGTDRRLADLAQETFLKALAGLASFAGTNFQAWLFRIGHNAFVNQTRAKRHVRQAFPDDLPARDQGPVEQAMSRETLVSLGRSGGFQRISVGVSLAG